MKLVQVAEQNKRYYTKEFIHGFNVGAKTQYEADSKERRGRWIKTKDLFFNPDGGGFFYGRRCSSCTEISADATNYCPNCGAKMDGEEDA